MGSQQRLLRQAQDRLGVVDDKLKMAMEPRLGILVADGDGEEGGMAGAGDEVAAKQPSVEGGAKHLVLEFIQGNCPKYVWRQQRRLCFG